MSETTIGIEYLPLKAGVDLEAGEAKSMWEAALDTISKQQGVKSLFWGRQIEHPDILQLAIDWESLDAHEAYIATAEYQSLLETLRTSLLSGPPEIFHTTIPILEPFANPFRAPVTECISGYFTATYPSAEYNAQFALFQDLVAKTPNVPTQGISGGWAVESQRHEILGADVVGKMRTTFIGWPSMESHTNFTKLEVFSKMIPLLANGSQGATLWHVVFKQHK
ncbi:hypothetical protein AA0116_g24 [Alternaria tenuissima]|nr:hypothetical protein AA0116_g24 [Alternaria tenuissima]